MHKALICLATSCLLDLAAVPAHAAPMHKCTVNGAVTYQQSPCASGSPSRKEPTLAELNAKEKQKRATAATEAASAPRPVPKLVPTDTPAPPPVPRFSCDGRIHCSQMKSCEEAKFFLANCPGVKMDGGQRNGIPCERQWCH